MRNNTLKALLSLLIVVFLMCCSKDSKRIRYRVVSQSNSEISYSMRGGPLKFESVSGDWSKSFRSQSGNPIYLSATKTGIFGNLTIQISVDGNVLFSQSTDQQLTTITIDSFVP